MATAVDLSGVGAVIFGVANHRSIAWAIARRLHEAGAHLTLTYQNERLHEPLAKLTDSMERVTTIECDVADDGAMEAAFSHAASQPAPLGIVVHSVAFAQREELDGNFSATSREGFRLALEVSAYSLIPVTRLAAARMPNGGSVITMTFHASEKVYPGYNVMGVAKAALDNEVRQLAAEFGPRNIRVNAISAGPLNTLAARGIHGFTDMQRIHAERAPLKRNVTLEEVGDAALFLASPLASGITGTILPVDAGYHIMGV
jgi:enoyl-[acyl-carrier protein] reductase I